MAKMKLNTPAAKLKVATTSDTSTERVRAILEEYVEERLAELTAACEHEPGFPGEFHVQPDPHNPERECYLWYQPEGAEDECPYDDTGVFARTSWVVHPKRFRGNNTATATAFESASARARAAGPEWMGFIDTEAERLADALEPLVDRFFDSIPGIVRSVKRETRAFKLSQSEGILMKDARDRVREEDREAAANERADGPKRAPAPVADDDVFDDE